MKLWIKLRKYTLKALSKLKLSEQANHSGKHWNIFFFHKASDNLSWNYDWSRGSCNTGSKASKKFNWNKGMLKCVTVSLHTTFRKYLSQSPKNISRLWVYVKKWKYFKSKCKFWWDLSSIIKTKENHSNEFHFEFPIVYGRIHKKI